MVQVLSIFDFDVLAVEALELVQGESCNIQG